MTALTSPADTLALSAEHRRRYQHIDTARIYGNAGPYSTT
jgi:hypothetical protein